MPPLSELLAACLMLSGIIGFGLSLYHASTSDVFMRGPHEEDAVMTPAGYRTMFWSAAGLPASGIL